MRNKEKKYISLNIDYSKAFLWSYFYSNSKYPQVRFYFCLHYVASISFNELNYFIRNKHVAISNDEIALAVSFANRIHTKYMVPIDNVSVVKIKADVNKMQRTLLGVYDDYRCKYKLNGRNIGIIKLFQLSCSELKEVIDDINISAKWIDFLSPSADVTELARSSGIETPLTSLYNELCTKEMSLNTRTLLHVMQNEILHEVTWAK